MIFKNLLRIMLPALLLVGSATAYALGEENEEPKVVTLLNNMATTWSDFVSANNDPSTAKVQVKGTLPTNDPAVVAVNNAQTKVDEALTALNTAKDQNNVDDLKEAWDKAKQDSIDYITKNPNKIKDAEKAYNDSTEQITTRENLLNDLKAERADSVESRTEVQGLLSQAKQDLQGYKSDLANLPKKTTSTTVGWMKDYVTYAQNFEAAYEDAESTPKIWYTYTSKVSGITLYVAFTEDKPTWTPDKNKIVWTEIGPDSFYSTIVKPSASATGDFVDLDIAAVYIYFGDEFAEQNNNTPTYKVTTYDAESKRGTLVSKTVSAVVTVSEQNKYQVNPTLNAVQDAYKEHAQTIQAAIAAAQAKVDYYNRLLDGFHKGSTGWTDGTPNLNPGDEGYVAPSKDILGINERITQIDNTTTKLTTLINNSKANLPTVKKAWDDAVAELEGYHTAIVNAKTAYDEAKGKVDAAQKAYDDAVAELTTAQTALATAQADADEKATKANYLQVRLTGDVEVTTAINSFSGEIHGDYHVITVPAGKVLFTTFTGSLVETAVNGKTFTKSTGGTFYSVARWNSALEDDAAVYYNDEGISKSYGNSLGELGYAARSVFGVDFTAKLLASKTDATTVHNIDVYDPA